LLKLKSFENNRLARAKGVGYFLFVLKYAIFNPITPTSKIPKSIIILKHSEHILGVAPPFGWEKHNPPFGSKPYNVSKIRAAFSLCAWG